MSALCAYEPFAFGPTIIIIIFRAIVFSFSIIISISLNVIPGPMVLYYDFVTNAKVNRVCFFFHWIVATVQHATRMRIDTNETSRRAAKCPKNLVKWKWKYTSACTVVCIEHLSFFFWFAISVVFFIIHFQRQLFFYYKSSLLSALICRALPISYIRTFY